MKTRLSTSKEAEDILKSIRSRFDLKANIICRYAIVLSLKEKDSPKMVTDNTGKEFNRTTLTGDDDLLFRELIKVHEGDYISDDEYMGTYLKAHIERGLRILQKNITQSKSFDNYLINLVKNGDVI